VKLLRSLVAAKPAESRYTVDDYVSWLNGSLLGSFGFQGSTYPLGVQTTFPGSKSEPIEANYAGYVAGGLKGNGIVSALENVRLQVFTQARFQWRRFVNGRPGELFGTGALAPLESPGFQARMILDADMAGNWYGALVDGGIVTLRPDWVDIVFEPVGIPGVGNVGSRKVGYLYFPGGRRDQKPTVLLPHEVAHFAPLPDPTASFRGMSWLTPVVRELMGDTAYTRHKVAFIENAATPNLAVSLKESVTPEQFDEFVDAMNAGHKGPVNAGKTLYLGGGADVTVVGANMKDLDFKAVQGAGETRLAAAAGVGAVIAQFSEGMQGSSLNAGNYAASRRRFADITMRHLWQEAAVALEAVVTPPAGAHLWYDARDIPFLQEDAADAASIRMTNSAAVRSLIEAGYEPDAATEYMQTDDIARLLGRHTGKTSVQLQEPGAADLPA
jgi:hypothetical protein